MATLFSTASTSNLTLTANNWISLIGGAQTVTGLGTMVQMIGYAYDLDYSEVDLRWVVDGTELDELPNPVMMMNKTLSVGSHTIDFQAISLNTDRTATTRGCTVSTL